MSYQIGLPAALARRGLKVETVPGWETRSAGSFNPVGAICHWTAGPATGDRPSLSICINGRQGLPGPLCNVFLTRAGVAIVCAAGRANHAGAGSWRGVVGNSSFFGTEAENSGYDPWTNAQRIAYPRINAAYCDLAGFGPAMVAGHNEYAPDRKIDIRTWPMPLMREQVMALLAGKEPNDMDEAAFTKYLASSAGRAAIQQAVWTAPVDYAGTADDANALTVLARVKRQIEAMGTNLANTLGPAIAAEVKRSLGDSADAAVIEAATRKAVRDVLVQGTEGVTS